MINIKTGQIDPSELCVSPLPWRERMGAIASSPDHLAHDARPLSPITSEGFDGEAGVHWSGRGAWRKVSSGTLQYPSTSTLSSYHCELHLLLGISSRKPIKLFPAWCNFKGLERPTYPQNIHSASTSHHGSLSFDSRK